MRLLKKPRIIERRDRMSEKKSTYKGYTASRAEANKRYMEKFVEVKARMTPEKRTMIQAHAEKQGESVNGFINRAIDETMSRDNAIKEAVSE